MKGTKLVTGLFVAALMAAFLLPIAIGAISGPEELTATQEVGENQVLKQDLSATLDAVNDNTNATYTVSNDADSVSVTVAEGTTETVTVDGTDVDLTLDSTTTSSATTTYEYPTTYGWSSGASALWGVLPIMIVLAMFLFVVGIALRAKV